MGEASASFRKGAGTPPKESSLMMTTHMSEDIAILEKYLSSQAAPRDVAAKLPYSMVSNNPGNPVFYLTVRRDHKMFKAGPDPGRGQREVLEQVLHPHAEEVRKVYFDHLHPAFPVLDETMFNEMWSKDNERISAALLCNLYATALSFWHKSDLLQYHAQAKPDAIFVWNQAIAALQDDFTAPTISTIHAALLNQVGRPVAQVTWNIVNAGRTATLAQSMGLHRDPTTWNATPHEKSVRIRLWWGILIHDYWSSIGHGIPPTINSRYYDVPVPTPEILAPPGSSEAFQRATTSFMYFCELTKILGDLIPFVYALDLNTNEVWPQLRAIETALDAWAASLPPYLHASASEGLHPLQPSPFSPPLPTNGSSNLWFSYLSLKLLVSRLALKLTMSEPSSAARSHYLSLLRSASSSVATFITRLSDAQLFEFWMPYTAYLLVTATTILLRCTIECPDTGLKRECAETLVALRERLKAGLEAGWDLGEFCIDRCAEPIGRVADALGISTTASTAALQSDAAATAHTHTQAQQQQQQVPIGSTGQLHTGLTPNPNPIDQAGAAMGMGGLTADPNFFLPIDSLDFPWENMWDSVDGPWSVQI